ncbi:aspartic peptidase domain-containing protein [Xylariales sp. PMI_506]|nr:aspartic peptidase domain-containing protein [Xylariales sp. PMI_506]
MKYLTLINAALVFKAVSARVWNLELSSRLQNNPSLRVPNGKSKGASGTLNVPLTDYINRTDNQWYSTFAIGTPPQYLTLLWDSGSPAVLIPESNCTTCGTHTLFDPSKSSTYEPLYEPFDIEFATGADSIPFTVPEGASGWFITDTVAIGDFVVENQVILLADVYAAALDDMPIDGILGIGIPPDDLSWYWNLYNSGQLDSPKFSFYIPAGEENGAEITLGGIDDTKYTGEIEYLAVDADASNSQGGFVYDTPSIFLNGQPFTNTSTSGQGFSTVYSYLDTGTAFIEIADFATTQNIYAQISPEITQIDPAGAWGAPCDKLNAVAPDITFTLTSGDSGTGQLNVTLPKEYFNLGEYPGQPGICQAVFNNPLPDVSIPTDGPQLWVIGSPLIKAYYTVWDGIDLEVGWAKPVPVHSGHW